MHLRVPTYTLSLRQHKEIEQRGIEWQIMLPRPYHAPADLGDPLAFARASLPDIDPQWIVAAAIARVPVAAERGKSDGTVTAKLGRLLDEQESRSTWHIVVEVIVATIRRPGGRPLSKRLPQWPLAVMMPR